MKYMVEPIFNDTCNLYKSDETLIEACKFTQENEKLYLAENNIDCNRERFSERAQLVVSRKRSFEAASCYKDCRVGVLNFANSFNPGGGVVNGSKAQEESLCRCSTLYDSLTTPYMMENFYGKHRITDNDLGTDDVIYSPKIKVFKSDTACPKLMPKEKWYDVDVLTCAAPNIFVGFNETIEISDEELSNLHEIRLRKILDVAVSNEIDVMVLGAFGCGAFGNPPEVVATVSKKVIADYIHSFKVIEFAINSSKATSKNFDVFNEIINN